VTDLSDLPEDYASQDLAPHAEDVCEGHGFDEAQCDAQGTGCCFWENNACWAAIDGACQVNSENAEPTELVDENSSLDTSTVIAIGLISTFVGSAVTFAMFGPRFQKLAGKEQPLLTSV